MNEKCSLLIYKDKNCCEIFCLVLLSGKGGSFAMRGLEGMPCFYQNIKLTLCMYCILILQGVNAWMCLMAFELE